MSESKKGDCPDCPACGWKPQGETGAPWYTDPAGGDRKNRDTKNCAPHCGLHPQGFADEFEDGDRFRCRYWQYKPEDKRSSRKFWDKNQDEVKDWFTDHNLDLWKGHSLKKEPSTAEQAESQPGMPSALEPQKSVKTETAPASIFDTFKNFTLKQDESPIPKKSKSPHLNPKSEPGTHPPDETKAREDLFKKLDETKNTTRFLGKVIGNLASGASNLASSVASSVASGVASGVAYMSNKEIKEESEQEKAGHILLPTRRAGTTPSAQTRMGA